VAVSPVDAAVSVCFRQVKGILSAPLLQQVFAVLSRSLFVLLLLLFTPSVLFKALHTVLFLQDWQQMRLPVGVECEAASMRLVHLDLTFWKMLKGGGLQLKRVLEGVLCQGVRNQTVLTAADAELPVHFANGLGSTEHASIEACQPELVSSLD